MQKRHVNHGSSWEEDEEIAAYRGYSDRIPFDTIVKTFPTDRAPKSIDMKLRNHEWEHTNGKSGLSGGNKWVKARWARARVVIINHHEQDLVKLRERRNELYAELDRIRTEIDVRQRRQLEIVRLPQ